MTLLEAWECYEKDKQLLNYSPYTLKGYKIQCSLLKKHFGNKTIGEFTKEQLKDYLLEQDHLLGGRLTKDLLTKILLLRLGNPKWAIECLNF